MLSEKAKKIIKGVNRFNKQLWVMDVVSVPTGGLITYLCTHKKTYNPSLFTGSSLIFILYIVSICLGLLSIGLLYYFFSNRQIKAHFFNAEEPDMEFFAKDQKSSNIDYDLLEELKQMSTCEKRFFTLPGWVDSRLTIISIVNGMILLTGVMVGITTKSYVIIIGALFLNIIIYPVIQGIDERTLRIIKEFPVKYGYVDPII